MEFITWCNENQGFNMVLLTFVYVVATILILVANFRANIINKNTLEIDKKILEHSKSSEALNNYKDSKM
ncbi:hypothetical protein FACS1894219_11880 [Clostridia bacterium]|nr:hypothetical protein FACS1894219_11880 [Clostridia bacterium]